MIETTDVADDGLVGRLHRPRAPASCPAVLVLGGAEGGLDRSDSLAQHLARSGFAALALAYFGAPPLPPMLAEIPLEYFYRALTWMRRTPGIDANRLGVLGGSKGGEAALLVGTTADVRAVVAYVPSHVVWQALNWTPPAVSSWQHRGIPLPFVPYAAGATLTQDRGLRKFYEASLTANPVAVRAAEIPVEQSTGALLLISGGDDGVWPSSEMSRRIVDRLRAHAFAHPFAHLDYPHAGHGVVGPDAGPLTVQAPWGALHLGGTEASNAVARADAWANVLQFLGAHLR